MSGFDTKELDAFSKDLLKIAEKDLPIESKNFLRKNARKLATITKNTAKRLGIEDQTGEYYSKFKSGKVYKYHGNLSCRAFNSSNHAHLLEYGHMEKTKNGEKFIPGFHVFEKASQEYQDVYYENCEEFIDKLLEKGLG